MGVGTGPSRRAVLSGGALLVVAGCTGGSAPPPGLSSDQRLARRAAAEIRRLSARYAATVTAHPGERGRLSTLAAEHDAHVVVLERLLPAPRAVRSVPSGSASAGTAPSPSPSVPPTVAAARGALALVERAAASRRGHQARSAGPELARVLASIAACNAVHAALVSAP